MSDAALFLSRTVGALDCAGIPYMLAGSFASSHHGAPRATQDIDVVIDPTTQSLAKFLDALNDEGVYFDRDVALQELGRRGQFNVIDPSTAWKADLIFRKARAFSLEEMKRRTPAVVLGVQVFVATAEDTVLAKLEWGRLGESERQFRDVRAIVEAKGAALDRPYIERWLDDLAVRELWQRVVEGGRGL